MAVLTVALSQPYTLSGPIAVLSQPYDIRTEFTVVLSQPYSYDITTVLSQPYSDMDALTTVLRQYYGDKPQLTTVLEQKYGNMYQMTAALKQEYSLLAGLTTTLKQPYSLLASLGPVTLSQIYDLQLRNEFTTVLAQPYSMFPSISGDFPETWVTIEGSAVDILTIDYDYHIDQYCGNFNLELARYEQWLQIDYKQEVIVRIGATDHYLIVVDIGDKLEHTGSTYNIECKSPAVLLDFPFASKVPDSFVVSGLASEVVEALANLEGLSVSWHMDSDPPLTSETTVVGNSPLSGIKSIVNALGGRINSHPDGTIHAVKRYAINSNEYDTAATTGYYTTGVDFTTLSTDADKRDGYNVFSVSNTQGTDSYQLITESITDSKYIVMAWKVPWSTQDVTLTTSETTNVTITTFGETLEAKTDEIEIVNGSGNVTRTCNSVTSWDYKDSTDLGNVAITEDGVVTTATAGNSIVEITYNTRYWKWIVQDTDIEKVQFILVTT